MANGDPTPQPTPTPAPAAPDVQSAPPSAPDLSGLTGPAPAPPTRQEAVQTNVAPYEAQNAEIAGQVKQLAQPTPAAPPGPHAKLLSMVAGLALGLDSFGKSIATQGKEGGATEVQQVRGEQQRQQIEKQQAAQAQKNAQMQQLMTVYDTNQKQMQSIINLSTIGNAMTKSDLEVKGLQQDIAAKAQEVQIQLADFMKANWYLTPDQIAGKAATTPADLSRSKTALDRVVNGPTGAVQILGKDNPAVIEAQKVASDPNPSPSDIANAGQGLNVALQQNTAVVEAKTKEQAAAETAPIGDKADDINAMTLRRYQAANPGAKTLPKEYAVTKDSTPADWTRMDKIMQQTENAQSTQATRNLANQIRQQTLDLLKGPSGIDANATGSAYLDQLKTADPTQYNLVNGYASGRLELTPTASRTAQGQALLRQILRAYPQYDQTLAPAYASTRKDFESGKTSVGINSYNTAIAHLGTMFDHVAGASNIQLNNPASDVNRQIETDKNFLSSELAKAVSNGQMTEGEKDQMLASISGKTFGVATSDKYKTQIKEVVGLLNGKLGSYQNQWNNKMVPGVEPPTIVSDESKATLDKIGGGTAQTLPSGGTPNQPDPFAAFGGKAR